MRRKMKAGKINLKKIKPKYVEVFLVLLLTFLYLTSASAEDLLTEHACLGCHASELSATILMPNGFPIVCYIGEEPPSQFLAGGNFWWVKASLEDDKIKGHNIFCTATCTPPPGYDRDYDPSSVGYRPERALACAGTNGCHGNRDIEDPSAAIRGSHHTPVDDRYYRFLDGIKGLGDMDWKNTAAVDDHNEYKGRAFANRNINAQETMSELCAECHGAFHKSGDSGIGTERPWLRHPTDIVLPNTGEFQYYNPSHLNKYNLQVPIARQTIPADAPSDIVTPGVDIVMCLSCHTSHGSSYPSILRWDPTERSSGCVICHTQKSSNHYDYEQDCTVCHTLHGTPPDYTTNPYLLKNDYPTPCDGDFDHDGNVDSSDLAIFAADFGRTDCDEGEPCEGDFDGDDDVDGSNLTIFAADFGKTNCPH
jgi:predicted CXXCH cytochrome family protein